MNKIINIGLTALFACFVAACENDIDNYDAPNGGVYGTIYDLSLIHIWSVMKGH